MKSKKAEAVTVASNDLNKFESVQSKVNQFNDRTAIQHLKELHISYQKRKHPTLPYYTSTKFTDKTSNGLTKCIILFLRYNEHQAERISSEGRIIDNRRVVNDYLGNLRTIGSIQRVRGSSQRGTADISATITGLSVKIEVKCKATKDRIRPEQLEYKRQIEAAGGIYFIASSFAQFLNWYYVRFGRAG
ncbi:hypothetical protein HXX01_01850 [Candidatus Nomurabacteria bacterium]|nr:hypothetical protein [Candidatus Nomurabacteria bacterium]